MNSFDWKWWRFAKNMNANCGICDWYGVWVSIFGSKYYFLRYPKHKYCSRCSTVTPAPADPYELPVCGPCNEGV